MKNIKTILITLGIVLFILGYFINSSLYSIVNRNLYNITDNIHEKQINLLKVEPVDVLNHKTSMLFSNKLCVFYDEINGIPISDNIDILSIIGKAFYYTSIVNFTDLVDLRTTGINTIGNISLRKEATEWLKYMTDNIKSEDITYTISSGFRDISLQDYIFKYKVSSLGYNKASLYAAKPGYSEHHLGTTVDILTHENNLKLMPSYQYTKLSKWLNSNSYKYGFIQSYPSGKSEVTGFEYEPWHYRYVGIELAEELKKSNLTLYEYLYSKYNYCLVDN